MNRWLVGLVAVWFAGCEPPTAQPSIRFVYPNSDEAFTLQLDEDCKALDLFVVVSVENFTLVDPEEHPKLVEGQGHYHFYYPDRSTYVVLTQEYSAIPPTDKVPNYTYTNGTATLSVVLADNHHDEGDEASKVQDAIEVEVVGPKQCDP